MKVLSTRTHGIIDYVMSLLVIASPWLFGFAEGRAETWVPVIVGATGLLYSICTNYELGVARILSMRTHLNLDLASGAFLAVSPWLFGFSDIVYMPHLILGILEIGAALMTDPVPSTDQRSEHQRVHGSGARTAH